MNLVIILAHTAIIVVAYCASRKLWLRGVSPWFVFVVLIWLSHVVARCGLFTLKSDLGIAGDIVLIIYQILFCLFAIAFEILFKRSPKDRSDLKSQKPYPEFDSSYPAIVFLSGFMGILISLTLVAKFGFAAVFDSAGEFHLWKSETSINSPILMRVLQTFTGTIQPFAVLLLVYHYKTLTRYQRVIGIILTFSYIIITALTGGRMGLAITLIPGLLAYWTWGKINWLKMLGFLFPIAVFVLYIASIRRVAYLGNEASYALLSFFGIEDNVFPEKFMFSSEGFFVINILSYVSSAFINFNNIIVNEATMLHSWGMQSFRLVNPFINILWPSGASAQQFAYYWNYDYLITQYGGAVQWPFTYGYFIGDFGRNISSVLVVVYAALLGSFSRILKDRPLKMYQKECLFILFYIGFTGFIMPVTAMQRGVLMLFIFCLMYFRGRRV